MRSCDAFARRIPPRPARSDRLCIQLGRVYRSRKAGKSVKLRTVARTRRTRRSRLSVGTAVTEPCDRSSSPVASIAKLQLKTYAEYLAPTGRLLAGGRIETDYMGQHHTAELLADGQIRFREETYGSLSSAGVAVKEAIRGPDIPESVRATDGWSFWRATDATAGDTVTLQVIRHRVATDHTARRGVSRSGDAREWLQSRASEQCLDPILRENPPPQQQFLVPGRPRVSLINGHSRSKESRAWPGTGMGQTYAVGSMPRAG
jgi:RAMA domain-containing protein